VEGRGREGRQNEGEKEGRKKEFAPLPNLHHRSTPLPSLAALALQY